MPDDIDRLKREAANNWTLAWEANKREADAYGALEDLVARIQRENLLPDETPEMTEALRYLESHRP